MEDILASIRRILNEDEPAAAGPAAPTPAVPTPPVPTPRQAAGPAAPPERPDLPPVAEPEPEPITLTEDMLVSAPNPGSALPPNEAADRLVAPSVAAATAASVGQLVRAVAAERHAAISRGGPSIEDVVREEIRPLLKTWLDEHLPPLVERLVRQEIERLVGRNLA
ncbi:DUF2497 domain-containing protein [Roseomonas sp. NAR14]|uniref:DUF2497 domain-containing protein n=1 Tax=Roseomonas acroporae TaxID=2937791 RepID=A0A9X1Y654_9PROT|nr:DUF2497 domain-containing protein [Roseomonas acroporae]MCK8783832.1 DUF2497 domain-containing protein [Roseomonas acroporae]